VTSSDGIQLMSCLIIVSTSFFLLWTQEERQRAGD